MGEQSKIAWCDSTVNFWSGCTKVSDGCRFCYAETLSARFNGTLKSGNQQIGGWGHGAPRKLHESAFKLAHRLNRKPWVCDLCGYAAHDRIMLHNCPVANPTPPHLWHRRRIFSLSLGDWLDPEVPVEWLARMLDTVRQCQDVDWLLCTKRPELWRERIGALTNYDVLPENPKLACWLEAWRMGKPPENIVVLTSVENQAMADKRIPELLRIPAWRRGLSCEPLLVAVNLHLNILRSAARGSSIVKPPEIDWFIVGGESGNKARPCNIEWVRSLKDQCAVAGVPCFVKQLGRNIVDATGYDIPAADHKGGDWNEWPDDLKVREFYKP